jgi:hypothetical protein
MPVIHFRSMTTRDTKARRDQIIRIVMISCGCLVPAVVAGTRGWGWPVHQALVEAALLLPVVAYVLTRLWFRHRD